MSLVMHSLLLPFSLVLCVLPASSMQVGGKPKLRPATDVSHKHQELYEHKSMMSLFSQDRSGPRTKSTVAVEITGCLQTLNTSEIQSGFARNIKAIRQAGWDVDIFGVVQACNPGRDELIVAHIGDMFKRACGELEELKPLSAGEQGEGSGSERCFLDVHLMPGKYDLSTGLSNDDTKDNRDLYRRGDAGVSKNQIMETDSYRLLSQHKQWKLVKEMRQSKNVQYDAVWKVPTDVKVLFGPLSAGTVQIPWSKVLAAVQEDPSLWIAPSKPYFLPEGNAPEDGEITDRVAILGKKAADHYDDMFDDDVQNLSKERTLLEPQSSIGAHMARSPDMHCRTVDIEFSKCFYSLQDATGRCDAEARNKVLLEAPASLPKCPRLESIKERHPGW